MQSRIFPENVLLEILRNKLEYEQIWLKNFYHRNRV